ncbi:hypothetical protein J3L18_16805 [Mucilaginibacter gossypii]|uniref:hypothetical protein n=1 Tax=Mucilaginibacter gossypii TaxID=551996 RepID=UPI000DCC175E|nr:MULTISPECIES: hypothetical protein [Mucilaginibacter]QTE34811.1 hypothetical protein J3L18_16805 [Mucilaginibacter gossypii]RAV49575.1 hypothetical protein DIU36_27340 [Mucilaginibacter rubeus]
MTSIKIITGYICRFAFIAAFALTGPGIAPVIAKVAKSPTIIIADTQLKAFEGIYQQKDNEYRVYKVTADGDKLIAQQLGGDQKLTLTRKSDLEFELLDDDGDEKIPVVFSKNEAGEINQITLGGRQIWAKINSYTPPKEVQLKPEQIKVLAGKYQSDERADLFLTITAIPDGLTLKQSWDGKEINFKPLSEVLFLNQAFGFPLKFTKDASGNPTKVLAFNRDTWNKVKE